MPLSDQQLRTIETEVRANDHAIEASEPRCTHDPRQFTSSRWLPVDWREQARNLELSSAEKDSMRRIDAALRRYRASPATTTVDELVSNWSAVGDTEFLKRHVLTPLVELAVIYQLIEAIQRRSIQVDERRYGRHRTVDELAIDTARLVEHDLAMAMSFDQFLTSRSKQEIVHRGTEALDAAKAHYNVLREMFPDLEHGELVHTPHITEFGEIVMVIESSARRSQRLAAREGNARSSDPVEQDDDDAGDNDDADATALATRGPDSDSRTLEIRARVAPLEVVCVKQLWYSFRFLALLTISELLPVLANLLAAWYQSGKNRTYVEQQYINAIAARKRPGGESLPSPIYASLNVVPIEVFVFGDYYAGYYGVNSTLDQGGYRMMPSLTLTWYEETARFLERAMLHGVAQAFSPEEQTTAFVLLTSAVVRTVAIIIVKLTLRGGYEILQRTLSRMQRAGDRARKSNRDREMSSIKTKCKH